LIFFRLFPFFFIQFVEKIFRAFPFIPPTGVHFVNSTANADIDPTVSDASDDSNNSSTTTNTDTKKSSPSASEEKKPPSSSAQRNIISSMLQLIGCMGLLSLVFSLL